MHNSSWSQEELSVIRALALQVRLVTAEQLAKGWFAGFVDAAARAETLIGRLRKASFIDRIVSEAHPLLEQVRPLFSWKVGTAHPEDREILAVAEQSRARWRLPHVPVEVFRAGKRACRAFGAFVDARRIKHCEVTHDLHLTEVFIDYRRRRPRLAAQWLGEGAFPKLGLSILGMKDPDAYLLDSCGVGLRVIEYGGSYEAEHLRAFHRHCAGGAARRLSKVAGMHEASTFQRLYPGKGIDYELW
jgi:hypothetical protein